MYQQQSGSSASSAFQKLLYGFTKQKEQFNPWLKNLCAFVAKILIKNA